jgi:NADH-ubiquinone oxidoreductase chain 2
MSILFRFSSQTLFFFWLRLEINIISILPILGARDTFFRREITIKYFISQSVASIIFLVLFFLVYFFTSSSLELIFTSAVLFKLGVPPFHR